MGINVFCTVTVQILSRVCLCKMDIASAILRCICVRNGELSVKRKHVLLVRRVSQGSSLLLVYFARLLTYPLSLFPSVARASSSLRAVFFFFFSKFVYSTPLFYSFTRRVTRWRKLKFTFFLFFFFFCESFSGASRRSLGK